MESNGNVWKTTKLELIGGQFMRLPESLKIGPQKAHDIVRRYKATLIAISYSSFSDPAIDSYFSEVAENVPKYLLRPITNPLKWALWSAFVKNSDNSCSFFGDVPQAEDIFGMENKLAAYVFLVDSKGQIRWKYAGPPSPAILDELKEKIKILFYE